MARGRSWLCLKGSCVSWAPHAGRAIRDVWTTRSQSVCSAANIKSRIIYMLAALLLHLSKGVKNVSDERVLSCVLEVDPLASSSGETVVQSEPIGLAPISHSHFIMSYVASNRTLAALAD